MEQATALEPSLALKLASLRAAVRAKGRLLVCFSGGTDSAFLALVAQQELGAYAVAVTADSESLARADLDATRAIAKEIGVDHVVVTYSDLENADYVKNETTRCYFCKKDLMDHVLPLAASRGMGPAQVALGVNADDELDWRPGIRAARERGAWFPLRDAGLTKKEIRQAAKELGLNCWEKPANACLSSRIAYGETITVTKLERVERAEAYLRGLGFEGFRVRSHDLLARIEVPPKDLERLATLAPQVHEKLREFGFLYVTLDLKGYRSGSMNEARDK